MKLLLPYLSSMSSPIKLESLEFLPHLSIYPHIFVQSKSLASSLPIDDATCWTEWKNKEQIIMITILNNTTDKYATKNESRTNIQTKNKTIKWKPKRNRVEEWHLSLLMQFSLKRHIHLWERATL